MSVAPLKSAACSTSACCPLSFQALESQLAASSGPDDALEPKPGLLEPTNTTLLPSTAMAIMVPTTWPTSLLQLHVQESCHCMCWIKILLRLGFVFCRHHMYTCISLPQKKYQYTRQTNKHVGARVLPSILWKLGPD